MIIVLAPELTEILEQVNKKNSDDKLPVDRDNMETQVCAEGF